MNNRIKRNNLTENTAKENLAGVLKHKSGGVVKNGAIKSGTLSATPEDTGWIEGYLVSWGNENDTDLQGEFFTPRTEFCLDWFKDRPVLYHHGLDGQAGLRKVGVIKSVEHDELGLWVQAQLNLRDRYANAVYDMVKSQEFGWSSGSVDHLVQIASNGEIACWPLIEGSITPTPAQPSKTTVRAFKNAQMENLLKADTFVPDTTVRAFKAILMNDNTQNDFEIKDFLRGLDARVRDFEGEQRVKSSFYIKDNPLAANINGVNSMAKSSAKRLARDFASAFGIKVSQDEINAVAASVEERVDEEVAKAAAEELETEAALAALEEEMVGNYNNNLEDNTMKGFSNRRSVRRYGRGYRSEEEVAAQAAEEIAAEMEEELAAQMDDIAAEMADEIAAELDEEVSAQADEQAMEKAAVRRIRNRLMRKAMRQLQATDDTGVSLNVPVVEVGGSGDQAYLGDDAYNNPPIENAKRYRRSLARRGYGYRAEEELAAQADEEAVQTDEQAMLMEEVAAQAYRNGFRKGARSAFRTTDEVASDMPVVTEVNDEVGNYENTDGSGASATASFRRRARRSMARRGYGYRAGEEELAAQADEEAVQAEEEAEKAFQKGYRSALRRAYRQGLEEPVMADEETVMTDEESMMFDEAVMQDPEAMMFDEGTTMSDELVPAAASYRGYRRGGRNFRGKSFGNGYGQDDFNRQASYWKNRAMKAELMEAPGQRFGNVSVTRDVADQPQAYNRAFKSYLYKGLGLMTDTEKYVLQGKGKVNWQGVKGTFGFDSNGAIKTYYGGSDASAGFAVPPDWVSELNKNVMTQTVMGPECRTRTTTSDRIVQPNLITTDARRSHAAQVRWPGEVIASGSEHRSVEDQYSQVAVPIHVMLISLTAGNSALEDVTFSLEDEINEAFSEAVAVAYDELIWGGDGQAKLEGIVVNNSVVGARSTGMQSVGGYIPSGSPDGIVSADVLKEMLFHLPRGYRQRAKWYMNSNTGLQIATLKDGEGNYLIDQRSESLQAVGVPDKLLGKPIVYNEYADDIAEDGFPIILGDLSRGYLIGKRVDFSIRRFDDSQYAELDQVLFLGRARLGGQVLQPAALKVLKVAAS